MNSPIDRMKYFYRYIATISIFSAIVTIPAFFEHEIKQAPNNATDPYLIPSDMRQHPYYSMFYVGILSLGLNGMVPFSLLVYFTYQIRKGISQNSYRASATTTNPREIISRNHSNISTNEPINRPINRRDSTIVVNLIVFLFLFFHSLRVGITIAEFSIQVCILNNKDYAIGCTGQFWLNILSSISDLFLVINSSVNTIVYKVVFWRSGPTRDPRPESNNEFQRIPLPENRSSVVLPETNNSFAQYPINYTTSTMSHVNRQVPHQLLLPSSTPSNFTVPNQSATTTALVHITSSNADVITELSHETDYEHL